MQRLHTLGPQLALKVNVRTPEDAENAWREFGALFVEVSLENVTPALLSVCHGLGMRVMVLYAGNEPEIFRRILASGTDMINTDYGNEFLAVMQAG